MTDPRANPTRDTLVIVRTVGERTTDACLRAARPQVTPRNLRVLSVRPFSLSVVQGFRTAARERPEWVFTVDADTILVHDAIARLRSLCDHAEPEVFHVQGLLLCRVHGGAHPRGFHAFRGSMLEEVLGHLDAVEHASHPETSVIGRMEAAGHPSRCYAEVLGIHDFEQRFSDLFLKLRRRARLAGDLERLRSRLRSLTDLHDDFRAASWGLEDGLRFPDSPDDEALARFEALCIGAEFSDRGAAAIDDPAALAAKIIDGQRPGALDSTHADFAFSGDPRRWALTPLAKVDPKSPSRESPWMAPDASRSVVA